MAYPTLTNTFTSGTTAIASQWNANFADIVNGLSDGTKDSQIYNLATAGTLSVTGDLYSTAWTDYSSTSTITGFSSYTVKKIFYKKIGSKVFCWYHLYGTGDSDSVYFTLPYGGIYYDDLGSYCSVIGYPDNMDDTLGTRVGIAIPINDNRIQIYYNMVADILWTSGVLRRTRGQISFETSD